MNSRTSSHSPSRFLSSRHPFCPAAFLAPDDGANHPGGDNNSPATPPAASPPATPPAGKSVAEQVQDAIAELLGKKGNDPMAAMDTLIRQNHALQQRAEAAETALPSRADRELLNKVKALNVPIEEVQQKLSEHSQWSVERAKNAKLDGLKKAAEKAGFNAEMLAALEGALDPEYSVIGEGDAAKAIVKVKNGDTVIDQDLSAWVGEKWPSLVDALKTAPGSQQTNPQTKNQPQTKTFTRYGQSAAVGAGSGAGDTNNGGSRDRIAERLEARREANKEKKNPLMS